VSEERDGHRVGVRRVAGGRYSLDLGDTERRIIGALAGELGEATADGVDTADPAYARLYPSIRPDDPAADAELIALVRPDLEDGRRAQLATVRSTLETVTLDEGQLAAWLGVCNDLRLVIAARLGVIEGDDGDVPVPDDPNDPDAWPLVVYHFLGWLVGEIVDALAAGLADDPPGEPA
jgi:hypothetical protein